MAGLVAVGVGLRLIFASGLADQNWLIHHIGKGPDAVASFIGLGAILGAIGAPRQLIAFAGGYVFGAAEGTLLAAVAQTIGAALAFWFVRAAGRRWMVGLESGEGKLAAAMRRAERLLGGQPFLAVLVIRLLPVGSNLATNLAAGLSSIPLLPFLAGSFLGYLPQTLIFALLGKGIRLNPEINIALSVVLFLLSLVLATVLWRKMKAKTQLPTV